MTRLKRSLALRKTPAQMYGCLAYRRTADPIPARDLRDIILAIAGMPAGYGVAVQILYMRMHSDKDRGVPVANDLVDAGYEVLRQISFTAMDDQQDFWTRELSKVCLTGERGAYAATEICNKLKTVVRTHTTHAQVHKCLLDGLFIVQPYATLDGLCGGDSGEFDCGLGILKDISRHQDALAAVPEAALLGWCDQHPLIRYPGLAQVVRIIAHADESPPRWTGLALRFLERAPDSAAVLGEFVRRFMPSSGWSGSLAAILESNAALLDQLDAYPTLREAVMQEKVRLRHWITRERDRETARARLSDKSFE